MMNKQLTYFHEIPKLTYRLIGGARTMADFLVLDETSKKIDSVDGNPLRLGRLGLSDPSNDNLVVIATPDNVDISTGAGNDIIIAHGGFNFINPGGGNNIMVGGSGQNAYTIPIPTAGSLTHNLITNLHVGDSVHLDGVIPTGSQISFADVLSAFGPALEMSITSVQNPSQTLLAVDLAGFSVHDMTDDPSTTKLMLSDSTLSVMR
jgi:hypothetical protein